MTHHRNRMAVCILAAFALFAAGLAQAGTTLTFLVDNNPDSMGGAKALVEAYRKIRPDVNFSLDFRPGGGEGDNLVKTRLATGEMTDVFLYNSGSLMWALNPPKNIADLTNLPCQAGIEGSFKKVVTVGGKVYGVPFGTTQGGGIFYNKRIYQELGLSVPKTWAEFIANCQKIKDSGLAAPIAQSYSQDTWTSQLFVLADYYNVQAAVPDFAEKYTANQIKYATTPAAVKGFEHLKEGFDKGFYNEDFNAANYPEGLRMLASGEAAHYPMLSFAIGAWNQDYPDELKNDIGFFAQPGEDPNNNGLTVWMPTTLYVYAGSKNLEEAKKFANFVGSKEGSEVYLSVNNAQGPSLITGVKLPASTPPCVFDMLPYFEKGKVSPALEFLSPIKGPALEQITVEVGSGMREPLEAAAMYDEDVKKQARQLGLAGW